MKNVQFKMRVNLHGFIFDWINARFFYVSFCGGPVLVKGTEGRLKRPE